MNITNYIYIYIYDYLIFTWICKNISLHYYINSYGIPYIFDILAWVYPPIGVDILIRIKILLYNKIY